MSSKITTETSVIQDKVEVHSLFCLRVPPTIFTDIVRNIQKPQEFTQEQQRGTGRRWEGDRRTDPKGVGR